MFYHHQLDIEKMWQKYEREFQDMPAPLREANTFCRWVEEYPLHIEKNDLFACWYGYETQEQMEAAYPSDSIPQKAPSRHPMKAIDWLFDFGVHPGGYDRGHHENNYKEILSRGMDSYAREIAQELENPENSQEKNIFLQAMLKSLDGARIFSDRFAGLAASLAEKSDDEADRARLLRIENACRKLPMKAPEDFFEALQAVVLIRALTCISYLNCGSVSLGAMDQYLYPYYKKSKEKGMSDEEIVNLLVQFFQMLDVYTGHDCAVSVGGVDENDKDATNELSFLMIKAEKISALRSPLFVARINKESPKEFLRELVSKELFEIGQPSFYSEENCRKAVMSRGIPEREARNFQISTCMHPTMAGEDATHAWGCMVNTHLPLELAVNGGNPLVGDFDVTFATEARTEYENIDEIYEQYGRYLKELLEIAMEWNKNTTEKMAKKHPNPWISLLTKDCIKQGKDRWDGGARYHNLCIEMMGFANTADGFTAIDKLVFKEKKYTMQEFIKAAQANYVGYEALHKDVLSCEKYGMNNETADENTKKLLDVAADVCEEMRTDNRRFLPSLHTLWYDVTWPMELGLHAFFDGRKKGEPINKNAGPTTLSRKTGPTALALSAGAIDQIRYSGGQALDVHISVRNMNSEANRDKIAAYIKTYFDMGGLQLQVNGISVDTLQKAYDDPDAYPNLMVRIGGHSRYFNEFENIMKQKFIERFKIEEEAFS